MRKMLYDFHDEGGCGIYFEEFVYSFEKETACPNCGHMATRCLTAPNIWWRQMGVSNDFPTSAGKWEKMQREKARTDKGGRADGQPNLKTY